MGNVVSSYCLDVRLSCFKRGSTIVGRLNKIWTVSAAFLSYGKLFLKGAIITAML